MADAVSGTAMFDLLIVLSEAALSRRDAIYGTSYMLLSTLLLCACSVKPGKLELSMAATATSFCA